MMQPGLRHGFYTHAYCLIKSRSQARLLEGLCSSVVAGSVLRDIYLASALIQGPLVSVPLRV